MVGWRDGMNELNLSFLLTDYEPYAEKWRALDSEYSVWKWTFAKNGNNFQFGKFTNFYSGNLCIFATPPFKGDPAKLIVGLSNGHQRHFPFEAVPIKPPVKKPELVQIWNDFINMFKVPEREEIHDIISYDD
jgi:hypothetical protein